MRRYLSFCRKLYIMDIRNGFKNQKQNLLYILYIHFIKYTLTFKNNWLIFRVTVMKNKIYIFVLQVIKRFCHVMIHYEYDNVFKNLKR